MRIIIDRCEGIGVCIAGITLKRQERNLLVEAGFTQRRISKFLIFDPRLQFVRKFGGTLERGFSGFVKEDYVYPVLHPYEARTAAECALSKVSETNAFLVLDWRALYSIYYVAYLEQGRTGIIIREALPYPTKVVTQTLLTEISEHVRNGEAVYTDDMYSPLTSAYKMTAIAGGCSNYRLFKLSLRN